MSGGRSRSGRAAPRRAGHGRCFDVRAPCGRARAVRGPAGPLVRRARRPPGAGDPHAGDLRRHPLPPLLAHPRPQRRRHPALHADGAHHRRRAIPGRGGPAPGLVRSRQPLRRQLGERSGRERLEGHHGLWPAGPRGVAAPPRRATGCSGAPAWEERLARAARFIFEFMQIGTGNINYPISGAAALAIADRVLGEPRYGTQGPRARARQPRLHLEGQQAALRRGQAAGRRDRRRLPRRRPRVQRRRVPAQPRPLREADERPRGAGPARRDDARAPRVPAARRRVGQQLGHAELQVELLGHAHR